jgi:hypothetical protein
VQATVFGAIVIGGFASLIWGWRRYGRNGEARRPAWRRALATFGLFLASMQGVLLATFWAYNIHIGGWSNDYVLFHNWVRAEFALFAVALPCLVVGSGRYRWWALLSSCLLFIVCFFVALGM